MALGRLLVVEFFGCDSTKLNDVESLTNAIAEAAKRAGATVLDSLSHTFEPYGVSVVVMIAESDLSMHTWPEHRYADLKVHTCGESLRPELASEYLAAELGAERTEILVDLPVGAQFERGASE